MKEIEVFTDGACRGNPGDGGWGVLLIIDVLASTEAALQFLTYLNEKFDGDWLLAMAAYNTGPTRVNRAIRKNKREDKPIRFWDLNLPKETTAYVPKLLVLCELIKDPKAFDVNLPSIANTKVDH